MDGEKSGDATAFGVTFPKPMARTLGSDHAHVDPGRGFDGLEANVEAMGEHESLPLRKGRADGLFVDGGLCRIGSEYHHHVRPAGDVLVRAHGQTGGLRFGSASTVGSKADPDVDPAVLKVEGVGVALGTIANDRNLASSDDFWLSVGFVSNLCHLFSLGNELVRSEVVCRSRPDARTVPIVLSGRSGWWFRQNLSDLSRASAWPQAPAESSSGDENCAWARGFDVVWPPQFGPRQKKSPASDVSGAGPSQRRLSSLRVARTRCRVGVEGGSQGKGRESRKTEAAQLPAGSSLDLSRP